MRGFTIALTFLAALPAHAHDADDPLVTANVHNLIVSYACRHNFGVDTYENTRAATAAALERVMGYPQAVVFVNDLDEKLRNDPRLAIRPSVYACQKVRAEYMHRLQVERARR